MPEVALPSDRVDLWLTPVDAWNPSHAQTEFLDWLDGRERATFDRYRFDRHKHLYLVSHALLRHVLSLYAHVHPAAWCFVVAPGGKPELAGPVDLPLRFNLSHTKGLAAVAVTGLGRIGVDVEVGKPEPTMIALGRRFFAPTEVAALERGSETEAAALAVELWTLKEAFMKAVGLGMALSTRRFAFDVEASGPSWRLLSTGLDCEAPESWSFATFDPRIADARAAVAVESPEDFQLRVSLLGPPRWHPYERHENPGPAC